VRIRELEFIKPDSPGLFLGTSGGRVYLANRPGEPSQGRAATVTAKGPLAVTLEYREDVHLVGSRPVKSTVELTFPSSKSWIETKWTIDDHLGAVESMGLDLSLLLESEPILFDGGATSTVYGTLKREEIMIFEAGPLPISAVKAPSAWVIRQGNVANAREFAAGALGKGNEPEGWVHVIDKRRCTALGLADFGRLGPDVIDRFEVRATGLSRIERRFLTDKTGQRLGGKPKKTIRFWAHFVTTPVQIGAVTSPQSMLAPLEVEWTKARSR
jgi:hypothetical protein